MKTFLLDNSNTSNRVRFYRTSKFAHLTVNQFLHQVIIGIILGDLHIEKPSIKHNAPPLPGRPGLGPCNLSNQLLMRHMLNILMNY